MERKSIFARLKKILQTTCPNKGIDFDAATEASRLREDLGMDSIEIIMTALAVESEFDIEITQYTADTFETVGNVVDYIGEALK